MKRFYLTAIVLLGFAFAAGPAIGVLAFQFTRPPILLVDDALYPVEQLQTDVTFDSAGRVHVVYHDNREYGTQHIYATTLSYDNVLTNSYLAYAGTLTHDHIWPFVFSSDFFPQRIYVGGVNTSQTMDECVLGYYETNDLPPTVTFDGVSSTLSTSNIEKFDMIGGEGYIFYVYNEAGRLYLNKYSEDLDEWGSMETVIESGSPERNYSAPSLAMDDGGYVYVVYSEYDISGPSTYVRARRSSIPLDIVNFDPEREVDYDPDAAAFDPVIAATGAFAMSDLKVAVAYLYSGLTTLNVRGKMEPNGDWGAPTPTPMAAGTYDISSPLSVSQQMYTPDIVYDVENNLYVVWSDDREGIFKLYGNASYDGGVSMLSSNEVEIHGGIAGLYGGPKIAVGDRPGDMAVSYSLHNGVNISPYLLVSRASFFDSCDQDPATTGYWTSYAGVSVATNEYFSPPASYVLENEKGTLLADFGSEEQQGSVTLQFFDSMSTTENFYVALSNDNRRGVIRMLGVRNDISPSNYAYSFDGMSWLDSGGARSLGWHEIQFIVSGDGLIMSIEVNSGGPVLISDPSFTGFTSIEFDGESGPNPYYVDDIRVEAFPLVLEPQPIPASSPMFILALILTIGYLIRYKK